MGQKEDYIVRATAANSQIRAFAIDSRNIVETAREKHDTSPVVTAALGRLLTAGAIGNMIDRTLNSFVVDFLYFKLIDFPVFNVADCYVTVGAALLAVLILFY